MKENKSVTTCAAMEIGDVYWLLATHQDTPNLLISRKNFCQLSERERERERSVKCEASLGNCVQSPAQPSIVQ